MPLYILLPMVVIGVAAVGALLHVLGLSKQKQITPENAAQLWARHFPDDTVKGVHVAQTGHAALVSTQSGPGLLWSFGVDTTARYLSGAELTETKNALRFDLHDFAAPAPPFP